MLYHTEIGCALLSEPLCPLPVIVNNITASLGIEEYNVMHNLTQQVNKYIPSIVASIEIQLSHMKIHASN